MLKRGIGKRFIFKSLHPGSRKHAHQLEDGESKSICMEYSSSNNSCSDLDEGEDSTTNNYVYTFSGDDYASSAYFPDEGEEEEKAPSPNTRKLQGWLAKSDKSSLASSWDEPRSTTSISPTTVALNPDDHQLDSFLFSTATPGSSHSKLSYFRETDESVANISYGSNTTTNYKEQSHPIQENAITAASNHASSVVSGRLIHQRAQRHLEEGRLDEALALFESILKAQRIQYGEMHKFVGAALHNVALVHIKAQRYGKALVVCQEAVMVRRKALGDVHLDLAQSLVKLGCVQMSLKDYDGAMQSLQEALSIKRKLNGGKDDVKVAQILSHVGILYYEIGELLAAVTSFEEALSIYRSHYADDTKPSVVIAETLANIGAIRSKRQQYNKAIVALEEAMMLQIIEYGDGHPAVVGTMDSLAYAYSKHGSPETTLELYKQILQVQRMRILEATNERNRRDLTIECAHTLHKMSIVYEKMNIISSAIECTSQVLEMQLLVCGSEDHASVVASRNSLSRLLRKEKLNVAAL